MNDIQEYSCGVVPFRRSDQDRFKILIIKHASGGHWGFPKGHMEDGESCRDTALRELREETGIEELTLSDEKVEVQYEFLKNGKTVRKLATYFAGLVEPDTVVTPQEEEVSDFAWVEPQEAIHRLHANMAEVVERSVAVVQSGSFKKGE